MKTLDTPNNIDEYIAGFPPEIQTILGKLRAAIRKAAPGALETISYQMPAYKQNGILVYFAAHKQHIGFYPTSSAILAFREELKNYKSAKGTVQFPVDKPIPLDLVSEIVKFRVQENILRAEAKVKKK